MGIHLTFDEYSQCVYEDRRNRRTFEKQAPAKTDMEPLGK